MSGSLSATHVDLRETQERFDRHASARFKFTATTAAATLILTVALLCARSKPVRADGGFQASPNGQASARAGHPGFATEIRSTLKKQHDRMIDLANQLIGRSDGLDELADQLVNQQITVASAKANFANAQLTREVAEIAVTEYEQGIFLQDEAAAQAERILAQRDRERARDSIEIAKAQLGKIKQASKGSASDVVNEFTFADLLLDAERRLPRSELALRQAESKLKILVEYEKPKRLKELRSEVEKARSVELAKRAVSELEQFKIKQLEEAIKALNRLARERTARDLLVRQALDSLDRAIPIEEKLRTKLEQLTKNGKPDDPLRNEIHDLSNQLQALIEQAEAARSAARFDELKTRIHAAAN